MTDDVLGYRGKTAVVTGCYSGMGEATARILGELGARVIAVDLKEPSVQHERFFQTDLSDPASIDATLAALPDDLVIDRLFNCAGVPHTLGPVMCMRINWIGLRYFAESLFARIADGGAIASISSDAGLGYVANMATIDELISIADPYEATQWCEGHPAEVREGYSFSKECIVVWTMRNALALAERQIRINCIAPSPTQTPFMVPTVEAVGRELIDAFPHALLGRWATAEDQAWPLVLLNSAPNAVVSGAMLPTDQGFAGAMASGVIDPSMLTPDL